MKPQKPFRTLLYYQFTRIENADVYAKRHLKFCKAVGLKGRILIASEGLNGTVSGTVEQTDAYIHALHMDPRFETMEFKIDEVDDLSFKKLFVRYREQIITLNDEDNVNPNEITGTHLSPKDWHTMLQRDDVVILDGRNDYEYDLGHFRNAIRPDLEAFRDFPKWLKENFEQHKDKKILTYCTGGIRCEKLSGYMIKEGYKDVYQLDGGIVKYGKDPEVKGDLWDGKCYVFDERIAIDINHTEEAKDVAKCLYCQTQTSRYVNCANPECNLQHFCCDTCEPVVKRSCTTECREHPRNRFIEEQELENA